MSHCIVCRIWFKVAIVRTKNQIFAEWREASCMPLGNGFRIKAIRRQRETVSNVMQWFPFRETHVNRRSWVVLLKKNYFSLHLSAFPFPHILKKGSQVSPFKWVENRVSRGRVPAEGIVVIADLFNSSDGHLPLSSTPLNKLMTDQVLLQKYQALKRAQWEQAARPAHWQEWGELQWKGMGDRIKRAWLTMGSGLKRGAHNCTGQNVQKGVFPELSPSAQ